MRPKLYCPICFNKDNIELKDDIYTCGHCGVFKFDEPLQNFNEFYKVDENWRLKIRHFIKKHSLETEPNGLDLYIPPFIITKNILEEICTNYKIPTLLEKIDLVMDYIETKTDFLSERIQIDPNKIFQLFFCKNNFELEEILLYLETNDFINIEKLKDFQPVKVFCGYHKYDFDEGYYRQNFYPIKYTYDIETGQYSATITQYSIKSISITPNGLMYQANNKKKANNSKQCFVAMWFNSKCEPKKFRPNMDKIYFDYIKPAVEAGGKYNSMRIDCLEHCDDINDRMIAEIRKSRFLLVDLTGYRGGVYWEDGFAEGLGLPVIYTCHEKWQKTDKKLKIEGIHFDINHRNIIFWNENNLEEFKERIKNRIEAIIF